MEFKFKGISWVGDIYQKFEEVCQEDAVKYLGNRVQNVGDSVKRFYSDVQEVLPIPSLVNSGKHGHLSLASNNNVDSPLESVTALTKNKGWVEENPVNKTIDSFHDSDANNLTNNQHAQASVGLDLVNRVHDENFSNSCEVADSGTTREEVGDDYFRETSGIMKKSLNVSLEQNAVKSTPELLNEKEPLDSSTFSASLDSLTSSELASSTKPSESSCLSESESLPARSQSSYCSENGSCKENSVDVARRSLDSSMVVISCTTTPDEVVAGEFTTSQAGLLSRGRNKSVESNEGETSVANEVIMPLNNLTGTGIKPVKISSAQDRAIIPGLESDERLVNPMESNMEDIQLRDDVKLNESCIFVDDMELHAASSRARRLRSYKKRIKDAFGRKKRLEKEYELLAIWYGDSDIEFREGTSQTVTPFSSTTSSLDTNNLQQVQNLCETEWELL